MKSQPTANSKRKVDFKVDAKGDIEKVSIDGIPLEGFVDNMFTGYGGDLKGVRLSQLPPKLIISSCFRRDWAPQFKVHLIEIIDGNTANVTVKYEDCPLCAKNDDNVFDDVEAVAAVLKDLQKKNKEILDVWTETNRQGSVAYYAVQVIGDTIDDIVVKAKAIFDPVKEHFYEQAEQSDADWSAPINTVERKRNKKKQNIHSVK